MRKITSFLSGLLFGGLVGVSVALLLAPSSGDDLRADLQKRVSTLQTDLTQAAQDRRIELENKLAELKKPKPAADEAA